MPNVWSREETILAFNLYCKTPFGRIHTRNPDIISLAKSLGRTPSAVALKLANIARLDPSLQKRNIAGASHGSKMDIEVWNEFHNDWSRLAFESEMELRRLGVKTISTDFQSPPELPVGEDRDSTKKIRVNQNFFRAAILAAYDSKCCITGLQTSELLVASHIVPWAVDPKNRTNPRNGVCLNALHDRAFDVGLITITPKQVVRVSPRLGKKVVSAAERDLLLRYQDVQLSLPSRFAPDPAFFEYHNDVIFRLR